MRSRNLVVTVLVPGFILCSCVDPEDFAQEPSIEMGSHRSTAVALTSSNGVVANGIGSNGFSFNGLPLNGLALNGLPLNGLPLNGLPLNGLALNGLPLNGLFLNGLALNGLPLNGLALNGLPLNGLPLNGLPLNGLPLNGLALNGLPLNGLPLNGLALNGLPLNGLALNGLPLNGLPLNGLPLNGLPLNGLPLNGLPLNGLALNGLSLNGLALNGLALNGLPLNGLPLNGLPLNGLPLNGLPLNGMVLSGVPVTTAQQADIRTLISYLAYCALPANDSIVVTDFDGTSTLPFPGSQNIDPAWKTSGPSAAVSQSMYNCVASKAATAGKTVTTNFSTMTQARSLVQFLAACALPTGDSVTLTDFDGTTVLTFAGSDGIDPGWKSGAPDPAKQAAMQSCVATKAAAAGMTVASYPVTDLVERVFSYSVACALAANDSVTVTAFDGTSKVFAGERGFDPGWKAGAPSVSQSVVMYDCVQGKAAKDGWGVAHSPVTVENFKKLLTYLTSCALGAGDFLNVTDVDGVTQVRMDGMLGLAPTWKTGTLDLTGQKYVSACLAARTNSNGQTVRISLRGPPASVSTATEVEKAAYTFTEGSFWGNVFTATPELHTCQGDGPGISGRICTEAGGCGFQTHGACATICGSQDASARYFSNCNGGTVEAAVLTTFLPLSKRLDSGFAHECLTGTNGVVTCWGQNGSGEIGIGSVTTEKTSGQPSLPGRVAQVALGSGTSCARLESGAVWCWGSDVRGELGDGPGAPDLCGFFGDKPCATTPVRVAALGTDVTLLASAHGDDLPIQSYRNNLFFALKSNGTLWAWGTAEFGIGDGTQRGTYESPVEITALGNQVAAVSAGNQICALKNDGTLWCWGWTSQGVLGNCDAFWALVPTQVGVTQLGNRVTDVATGYVHTCARTSDGAVWCTGGNGSGQAGYSVYSNVCQFTQVAGIGTSSLPGTLVAGTYHTCVGKPDGVYCWGDNTGSQLGIGDAGTIGLLQYTHVPQKVILPTGNVQQLFAAYKMSWAVLVPDWTGQSAVRVWGVNLAGSNGTSGANFYIGIAAEVIIADITPDCGVGNPAVCDLGESKDNCAVDCTAAVCGDSVCQVGQGEDLISCSADCTCGNAICDVARNETTQSCQGDCYCGNGACEATLGEDTFTCATDCYCGNGTCESGVYGETYANCPGDCTCGNGVCDIGETSTTCGGDCCAAETNAAFCARMGGNCGSVSGTDNCGQARTVTSCGTCASPFTCGGDGTSNVCGRTVTYTFGTTTSASSCTSGCTVVAADSYVASNATTTNYGTATSTYVNGSTSATKATYLKITLPAGLGSIQSLAIKVKATTGDTDQLSIYRVATTTWVESGTGSITWANKPAPDASALASTSAATGAVATFNVGSSYAAGGTYSFVIRPKVTGSAYTLGAKEHATAANKPTITVKARP